MDLLNDARLNKISGDIVRASIKVHSALGPGLLERAYVLCLGYQLQKDGHSVRTQVPLSLQYDGVAFGLVYRLDLLVDDAVVVEVKAIEKLAPIHSAQLLSYLRVGGYRLGLLLNFHSHRMRTGIRRIAN